MSSLTLQHDNRSELLDALSGDVWFVACLCAAWCDVCRQYRPAFEALAERHPDKQFVWIDIEDEADIVGDFDVENFPTLLLARGGVPHFFGTLLPHAGVLQRLLAQAQAGDLPPLGDATARRMAQAVGRLVDEEPGEVRVEQLAKTLGLSTRQFQRRFRASSGLTPKQFLRTQRIRATAVNLVQNRDQKWAERAAELGFADQAHMTHEFVSITNRSPKSFAESLSDISHGELVK